MVVIILLSIILFIVVLIALALGDVITRLQDFDKRLDNVDERAWERVHNRMKASVTVDRLT